MPPTVSNEITGVPRPDRRASAAGAQPSRPSAAPSRETDAAKALVVPRQMITAATAITPAAETPSPRSTMSPGDIRSSPVDPYAPVPTTATATPRESTVTTRTVSRVARGRVRRTSRNSADRCAIASQPANAKNSTITARPIPETPWGANGANRASSICGTATTITVRRRTATPMARPICIRAPTLAPARFAAMASASTTTATAGAAR